MTDASTAKFAAQKHMPFLLDVRYRLEYAALRALVGIIRSIPVDTAASISAKLVRTIAPRGRRHKRALENLARAFPEKTPEEREAIALDMWENLGRVMAESMQLDRLINDPDRVRLRDTFFVDRYGGKRGAAVCVSMHSGNWELAAVLGKLANHRSAGIYRVIKNPYVDRYVSEQRQELYPHGLLRKGRAMGKQEGQKTARIITDYVRKGGRLGIISDLYDHYGIAVPFFGVPAKSTPMPAMIARRVGSRLWIVRIIRLGRASRFEIHVKELKVPHTRNQIEDIQTVTAAIQKQFEDWIREYPEQFVWSNRRWA